jgi:hypothetical protein
MIKRKQFLTDFLGALGAKEILFSDIGPDTVTGTVVYDPSDPEERQDFRWHACEADVPAGRSDKACVSLVYRVVSGHSPCFWPIGQCPMDRHDLSSSFWC